MTIASGGNRSKVGQLVFDPFNPIGSDVWRLYLVDFYGKCTVSKYTIHRFVWEFDQLAEVLAMPCLCLLMALAMSGKMGCWADESSEDSDETTVG